MSGFGLRGPRGAAGAAGADGADGITNIEVSYTNTGDMLANGGTEDFQAVGMPLHGLIKGATITRTLGDSTAFAVQLFDGDPGGAGVAVCYIYGSGFAGVNATTAVGGPKPSLVGTDILMAIPYKVADPWIRLINRDAMETGRCTLALWIEEMA